MRGCRKWLTRRTWCSKSWITCWRMTLVHGRHSTQVEVILRMLIVKHLYRRSYQETAERVADSLVLRWFRRAYL